MPCCLICNGFKRQEVIEEKQHLSFPLHKVKVTKKWKSFEEEMNEPEAPPFEFVSGHDSIVSSPA